MSSIERGNIFQEETPEETKKRLEAEELRSQRLKEMESIPNYKRVSGELKQVSVEEKRREARRMAQETAEKDAERRRLNDAYKEKPQDSGAEFKMQAGKRGKVEVRQNKVA